MKKILVLMLVMILTACSTTEIKRGKFDEDSLIKSVWVLEDTSRGVPVPRGGLKLKFLQPDKILFLNGSDRFLGRYKMGTHPVLLQTHPLLFKKFMWKRNESGTGRRRFWFKKMQSTKARYINIANTIESVKSYELRGRRLYLYTNDGRILVFKR